MTKVLFVHDGYVFNSPGGCFSYAYTKGIIQRYFNYGDCVTIFVRGQKITDPKQGMHEINASNLNIIAVPNFKSLSGIHSYWGTKQLLEQEILNADIVFARVPSDLGFIAAKYASKIGRPYVVEVVGCPWDSYRNHSIPGKLVAPIYYCKQRRTLKKAKEAVYVTSKFLQSRYPCGGNAHSCSDVQLPEIAPATIKARLARIKETDMDSLVFGSLGPVDMKYKGFDLMIKALAQMHQQGKHHRYIIAGSGNPRWLKSVVARYDADSWVDILPAMPHEEVFRWFETIDVYVQPSRTEGMPRALLEAMSVGCPCLGSTAGGIKEVLSTDQLFSKGSHRSIQALLNKLTREGLINSVSQGDQHWVVESHEFSAFEFQI